MICLFTDTSIAATANLGTSIMDFRGCDSSVILILRGGIPRPMGNFPESLSQAILVGVMLVGRLGVLHHRAGQKIVTIYKCKRKEPTNDKSYHE